MAKRSIDHTNQRFGRLLALRPLPTPTGMWLFQCDCGVTVRRMIGDTLKSAKNGYIPACRTCNTESKRQFNLEDFTGQRFGDLVAVSPTEHYRGSFRMWTFQCQCGQMVERVPADVRAVVNRGHKASCPTCRQPSRLLEGDSAVIHRILTEYRNGARIRSLEFALNDNDIRTLVTGNCFYCGMPPSRKFQRGPKSHILLVNGIDRMNNRVGYVLSNVVSCCWECNRTKRDAPFDEWMNWLNRIVEYRQNEAA